MRKKLKIEMVKEARKRDREENRRKTAQWRKRKRICAKEIDMQIKRKLHATQDTQRTWLAREKIRLSARGKL